MAYRIDPDGKFRIDSRNTTRAVSSQQQRLFQAEIAKAARDRAEAGGPKTIDPTTDKVVVIEPGDNLWQIAKDYNVQFSDMLAANRGSAGLNGNLIRPDDVVIVPKSSPELVARDLRTGDAGAEKIFLDDIYTRGNKLAATDGLPAKDYRAGADAIKKDVGAYLDGLPASQRQAAALRLSVYDWEEGGPARQAVTDAITQRGLETNQEQAFANDLYMRGNHGAYADDPNHDYAADKTTLVNSTTRYIIGLPAADQGAALQRLYDRDWLDGGQAQSAIEETAKKLGIGLRPSTHAGLETEAAARKIIDDAGKAGKPEDSFHNLSAGYSKATPEVRKVILASQDARALIGKTADWATERLKNYDPEHSTSDQGDAATVMYNLQTLTDGADPALSVELMSSALPTIEAANVVRQEKVGTDLIGMNGLSDLMKIIDRIGGTPGADAVVKRFAALGCNNINSIPPAISGGSRLDYPLALGSELDGGPDYVDSQILPSVKQFAAGTVNRDVDAYAGHTRELSWLMANGGPSMTPDQLSKAIADYKAAKGPNWNNKEQSLEGQIADDGKKLLIQLNQLANLPPELAGQRQDSNGPTQQQAVNDQIVAILGDDKTYAALRVTLQKTPDIIADPKFDHLAGAMRLTDRGRKLVEEATTQIVRRTVIPSLADFDPRDPVSVQKAKQGLAAFRDGKMSKLLGVPQDDLTKAADALERSLPEEGDTLADTNRKMTTLDSELNGLTGRNGVKSFVNKSFPGQLLRFVGVSATGAGLLNSSANFVQDPSWKGGLKFIIDAAGVSQRVLELSNGVGVVNDGGKMVNTFGSSSKPAVKALGALGAAFDIWNAIDSFRADDPVMGGLSLTMAGGTVMAALGTGTMLGPAGLIIVAGAVFVQWLVVDHRASTEFETDTTKDFLAHSEMSPEVAEDLRDESGDGYSPVPILMRYAEMKGFDMKDPASRQKFFGWLNGIPRDQLRTLRDNLHHTLDAFDGNVSKLSQASEADRLYADPEAFHLQLGGYESLSDRVHDGKAAPSSVTQIDVAMKELGIAVPAA